MDPPETPNSSQGTVETAAPYPAFHSASRRSNAHRNRGWSDTSRMSTAGNDPMGPPLIELPETGAQEETPPDTAGLGLTPLTGMSSELQGMSTRDQSPDPEEGAQSGEEISDSDNETELSTV